jgi:divalent metal cation (Fe/Co/Zn/Cd) transporter
MNSQILIANAWHHRSDAFSSVLSLASIGLAMAAPSLLVVDSAAGILVAGMICMTGIEVLFESVKQLADTGDSRLENKVIEIARDVEGVLGVKNARTRTVGSGTLIDVNIMTDSRITTSAANNIVEKCKWTLLENIPNAMEVSVRNNPMETVCPLLTQNTRTLPIVEREVRDLLAQRCSDGVIKDIRKISVNYISTAMLSIELVIKIDPTLSIDKATNIGKAIQADIKNNVKDVFQAEVYVDIGDDESALTNTANLIKSMPVEQLSVVKQ